MDVRGDVRRLWGSPRTKVGEHSIRQSRSSRRVAMSPHGIGSVVVCCATTDGRPTSRAFRDGTFDYATMQRTKLLRCIVFSSYINDSDFLNLPVHRINLSLGRKCFPWEPHSYDSRIAGCNCSPHYRGNTSGATAH